MESFGQYCRRLDIAQKHANAAYRRKKRAAELGRPPSVVDEWRASRPMSPATTARKVRHGLWDEVNPPRGEKREMTRRAMRNRGADDGPSIY